MPTVDDLSKTSGLFAANPAATTAAFFALAFVALLALHLRTVAKLSKEHAAEMLTLAIRLEHLATKSFEVMTDLRDFLPRKKRRRPAADPTQVTVLDAEAASEPDKD